MTLKEKTPILIFFLTLSALAGIAVAAVQTYSETVHTFVRTDMSGEFPELDGVRQGGITFATNDINVLKHSVDFTVRGTVVAVGELEFYQSHARQRAELLPHLAVPVLVPIGITVHDMGKRSPDVDKGDTITIRLGGMLIENVLYLESGPQFITGEDVIVHVSVDDSIMMEDMKYINIAEYGKYRIQNDKAYNANHPAGIPIQQALDEAK